jgi:hypothetical protein
MCVPETGQKKTHFALGTGFEQDFGLSGCHEGIGLMRSNIFMIRNLLKTTRDEHSPSFHF